MEEKRKHFRIIDKIYVSYRVIDQNDLDQGIIRLRTGTDQQDRLFDSLYDIDERLDELLENLGERSPAITQAVQLINRKSNLIAKVVGTQIGKEAGTLTTRTTYDVNLSGGGISFKGLGNCKAGDLLELSLVLFPEVRSIHGFGEVIHCHEQDSNSADNSFEIGVKFIYLAEEDREFLISHVLNIQSAQLRKSKDIPHSS